MKKSLLAIALAAAMTPFTFAAQTNSAPASNNTTKTTTKKHSKKSGKHKKAAEKPAAQK